jgi:hypothetical protein
LRSVRVEMDHRYDRPAKGWLGDISEEVVELLFINAETDM